MPERCSPHDRDRVLARHDGAAQVHRHHAVEGLLGDLGHIRVPAGHADPDIVVQDVETAPPGSRLLHCCCNLRLARDVRLEGRSFAVLVGDHFGRFAGRCQIAVDAQHPRALAREEERRGAAVAHAVTRTLPRAHDDRDLAFQSHRSLPVWLAERRNRRPPHLI